MKFCIDRVFKFEVLPPIPNRHPLLNTHVIDIQPPMMFKNFCWALRQKPSQWLALNYL